MPLLDLGIFQLGKAQKTIRTRNNPPPRTRGLSPCRGKHARCQSNIQYDFDIELPQRYPWAGTGNKHGGGFGSNHAVTFTKHGRPCVVTGAKERERFTTPGLRTEVCSTQSVCFRDDQSLLTGPAEPDLYSKFIQSPVVPRPALPESGRPPPPTLLTFGLVPYIPP